MPVKAECASLAGRRDPASERDQLAGCSLGLNCLRYTFIGLPSGRERHLAMDNADALRQFLVQHTSRIAECTVPLFGDFPGGPDHFGTGVLLKVGETHFLLT